MFVILLQEVIVGLEEKFIYSSYLYYHLDISPITDCEIEDKMQFLREVAKRVGVDLDKELNKNV